MNRNGFGARASLVFRIALIGAGLVIIFFSGIFPLEEYLAQVPVQDLTASVIAADVAELTNENRTDHGLPALSVDPLLTEAAQLKAEDMAKRSYYAHISPDGKSPLYWLNKVGYKYLNAGENLVIDRTTSEEAVDAWMDSPDHRENILRPQFTEIGIGVAEGKYDGVRTIFVVQEFGTPYPLSIAPKPTARPAPSTIEKKPRTEEEEKDREEKTPAPSLAVTPLPRTSVVTQVNVLAAPAVHALAPAAYPDPAEADPSSASTSAKASSATTSSSTLFSTVPSAATSSASFVLAPEFFSPVTVAPVHEDEVRAPVEAEHIAHTSLAARVKAYMQRISRLFTDIWTDSSSS